jgi:hypothetical protein
MSKTLPLLLLLLLSLGAFAQTPKWTQSTPFTCNQQTCNAIPLDQGGKWQFILANGTFSVSSSGFDICGNAGSTSCPGGITELQNGIPLTGAEGTLVFNWIAVQAGDPSVKYSGYAYVRGHQTHHCYWRTCWYTLTVDSAQIYLTE